MLRSRFFWKLYAGYSALILISSVVVGITISRGVERDTLQEVRQSLEARATFLREMATRYLTGSPDSSVQDRVRALGTQVGTRLTVIRADGVVIADSDENPAAMDNHSDRPEVLAAHSHGLGTSTRLSNTLGMRMMYLALSVRSEGRSVGYVRTAPSSLGDRSAPRSASRRDRLGRGGCQPWLRCCWGSCSHIIS